MSYEVYNDGRFEMVKFSDEQVKFLSEYKTADERWTSQDEMKQVEEALGLRKVERSLLRAIRNSVVKAYHNLRDSSTSTEERYSMFNSMMSVTAVIDNVIYAG